MFAGAVEETGILLFVKDSSSDSRLVIGTNEILEDIKRRDSIAVSGVCLIATSLDSDLFLADVTLETPKRPNPGCLLIKSSLNLERVMIAGSRSGRHIMSGHIDGTGTVVSVVRDDNALWYTIRSTPSILCRIIEKGSIAIDGVSLMVAQARGQDSGMSLIPHTASHITLETLKPGRMVNLENDCVGKYIERSMKISPPVHSIEGEDTKNRRTGSRITPELLKQCGL